MFCVYSFSRNFALKIYSKQQVRMEIARTARELRQALDKRGKEIGFVPTMGALHQGHISLVRRAREENGTVAVSIFVNPTQFNDPRDLAKYPRTEEADLRMLEAAGTDIVFVPSVAEVYPDPDDRQFDLGEIGKVMEGAHRPGHFNGVAQVVSRLFDIVEPHRAYFGDKDFQQVAVIEALVRQLGNDVEIVRCPIVRDGDGLALSSRNALLTPAQRQEAPRIYRTLARAAEKIAAGGGTEETAEWARQEIDASPELETEYIEVADEQTLQSVAGESGDKVKKIKKRIFAAVKCGEVRLIDNVAVNQ